MIEVPDELYEALQASADHEGLSLPDYLARDVDEPLNPLSPEELLQRLSRIPPLDLGNLTAADIIREGREERTDQIIDALSRR